jgi:hypothetical protein
LCGTPVCKTIESGDWRKGGNKEDEVVSDILQLVKTKGEAYTKIE